MRLKIFTADSMKVALKQVRDALGDDAVIVNSVEEEGKVKVTAAIEIPTPKPVRRRKAKVKSSPVQKSLKELEQDDWIENVSLSLILTHHGIGKAMKKRILETAASFDTDKNIEALSKALEVMFDFSPWDRGPHKKPLMLVGPPGSGKTVTAAKLCSQAIISGQNVRLINTDMIRTGSTAQLEGYAEALNITVIEAYEPDILKAAIETGRQTDEVIIIDSMGYNPFDPEEMTLLQNYIQAHDVEPLLVIAAGGDPHEAEEIAESYAALGITRFIATRLDIARRYGSLLITAGYMDLAFAGVGITPYLAGGIEQVDAMSLARLLTRITPTNIQESQQ